MNDAHGITAENLLISLPPALANDKSMMALAAGVSEVLAARIPEIDAINIYSRIDELPEDLLDILAYDFKVDWWDGNYTLEEKRQTIKSNWRVHRQLGTKAAVETAIRAIYPATEVQEWWEYGGEPYHFRLVIDPEQIGLDPEKHKRVLQRAKFYKNQRSWMDEVSYLMLIAVFREKPGSVSMDTVQFTICFSSYGIGVVRLDGQRRLDGSWLLDQRFTGLRMPCIDMSIAIEEHENICALLDADGVSMQNTEQITDESQFFGSALNPNTTSAESVSLSTGIKEEYSMSGKLVRDSLWCLDGSELLDGSRKLHASITEEEI